MAEVPAPKPEVSEQGVRHSGIVTWLGRGVFVDYITKTVLAKQVFNQPLVFSTFSPDLFSSTTTEAHLPYLIGGPHHPHADNSLRRPVHRRSLEQFGDAEVQLWHCGMQFRAHLHAVWGNGLVSSKLPPRISKFQQASHFAFPDSAREVHCLLCIPNTVVFVPCEDGRETVVQYAEP
ncbi:hypothetical protein VPH35_136717 [Triticum aestivum]|uniref:Uncharacterized protein n=1 Tax=Aegilops tauschii TaxID=37682 RepID=M8CGQ5_AEGTA